MQILTTSPKSIYSDCNLLELITEICTYGTYISGAGSLHKATVMHICEVMCVQFGNGLFFFFYSDGKIQLHVKHSGK